MTLTIEPRSDLVELVGSFADTAVADAEEGLYGLYATELARFGDRGRNACRQDLRYHLDYLRAALACGNTTPFRDYAGWLAELLNSRGVPSHHLPDSFRLLDAFFRKHMPQGSDLISAILLEGISAVNDPPPQTGFNGPLEASDGPAQGYLDRILASDRVGAELVVLETMHAGASLVDVEVDILQPALYEIGRLWQINRITVAQEHLATAICQNVMARLFTHADFSPSLQRKALLACAPGSQHSLGLRMVSDAFEVAGWEVQYLGADTPAGALVKQVEAWQPEVVGLSLSLPHHIEPARQLITQLRGEFGARCPAILIGGLATNRVPGLWKVIGADLWGIDARASLREVMS